MDANNNLFGDFDDLVIEDDDMDETADIQVEDAPTADDSDDSLDDFNFDSDDLEDDADDVSLVTEDAPADNGFSFSVDDDAVTGPSLEVYGPPADTVTDDGFDFGAIEDDGESSDNGFSFDTPAEQSTNDLFGELNGEGDWLTGASLEDSEANDSILSDTVDKNSFEGLFATTAAPTMPANASVLEAGAMNGEAFALKYLSPADIIVWGPRIRKNTDVTALVTSIENDGLLQPLVVAPTQTEGRYVLIKGARRLLACATLGMKSIPCIVNSQITISDIHVVEPLYSHSKPYSVSDMLAYIDYLKDEKGIVAPSMIEYLLNMNSGDYMKLMDVMDDNDDEIVSLLLGGQIDIGGAFKKLEQKRKKMGKDKMSTARTEKIYNDAEAYGADILADSGETGMGAELTDDEIKEIVNGMGDLDDVSDLDGEELKQQGNDIDGYQPHKQDPNNRERLDPKLRKAVLARDNCTCRICGMGGQEYTETMDVHHIVEVYLGGNDDIDNLICACTVCHKLVHLWGRGELTVRPFDQMNEAEANKFKRIIKLGNIIRKGMADKGLKREQLKKMDQADTIGRRLKGSSDQVAG